MGVKLLADTVLGSPGRRRGAARAPVMVRCTCHILDLSHVNGQPLHGATIAVLLGQGFGLDCLAMILDVMHGGGPCVRGVLIPELHLVSPIEMCSAGCLLISSWVRGFSKQEGGQFIRSRHRRQTRLQDSLCPNGWKVSQHDLMLLQQDAALLANMRQERSQLLNMAHGSPERLSTWLSQPSSFTQPLASLCHAPAGAHLLIHARQEGLQVAATAHALQGGGKVPQGLEDARAIPHAVVPWLCLPARLWGSEL